MGIVGFNIHCYSVLRLIQWFAYPERAIFKRDLTRQFQTERVSGCQLSNLKRIHRPSAAFRIWQGSLNFQ